MTKKEDDRLLGRPPEFSLMSRNPGIGGTVLNPMIEAYKTKNGKEVLARNGWIIERMRINGIKKYIAPYIQGKVTEHLGLTREDAGRYRYTKFRAKTVKGKLLSRTYMVEYFAKVSQQEGRLRLKRKVGKL